MPKQDSPDLNAQPNNQSPTNDTKGSNKDALPPFPPIQEVPRLPDVRSVAPQNDALTRDLSVVAEAMEVQKRLITLGFLIGLADVKWGAQSKHALLNLRKANKLTGVDAHALDGQRRPACWCGDIETGRHDESELLARSEHILPPP